MNNPGVYVLGALPISAARSPAALLSPILGLDGMSAVSLECVFQYGAGGTSVQAIVATSFDGTLWRHIARFDFTTAPLTKAANISGLTAKGVVTYADLAAEGVADGILGNQLALLVSSVGTYSNGTLLTVRAAVR